MKRVIILLCLAIPLSACSHKELTAPCSSKDIPKQLAFSGNDDLLNLKFPELQLGYSECGPMRSINDLNIAGGNGG
ncbi:hypothetical protein [Bartonella choladocola]|uniref:Uncharacterized protein n=1 Tax=Bartonella choladocola TaxID=2750995 RepID=A0A1U9MJI6_9HYPH|nr:hypothetical protein [Bartonella choladocola]AQT48016.1 hypothetical protein BBC0122_019220 [Bartonella choladocola]